MKSIDVKIFGRECALKGRGRSQNLIVHSRSQLQNKVRNFTALYSLLDTTAVEAKVKCTLVQALRLCTGRTAHRGSRSIAVPFLDHGTRRV